MSSGNISRKLMADVEACLHLEAGRTPAQVHERLGCWSLITVRHALRQLVEDGRAAFSGTPLQSALSKGRSMRRPANQLAPTDLPVRPDKYFIATLYAEVLARTARSRAQAQADRKSLPAAEQTEQHQQSQSEADPR